MCIFTTKVEVATYGSTSHKGGTMGIPPEENRRRVIKAFEEWLGSKGHIVKLYGISDWAFRRWWKEY